MKASILIVDDMEINRVLLKELFCDEYNIIEAENGCEALKIINSEQYDDIAAIMLDLMMPVMDGISVLTELNTSRKINYVPVFIITAAEDLHLLTKAYSLGAVDIISKPFQMCFIKARIGNIIELYKHRNRLADMVNEAVAKMNHINDSMVETLAAIVEFRDVESGEHVRRIRGITKMLMTSVSDTYPEYHLDPLSIEKISIASVLHDVGKIAIPDSILQKPGRLTAEERELMKLHTTRGCEILKKMPEGVMDEEVFNYSYEICRHHHERYDGAGYPDQLKGDETPIWAQVAGLADVFDALTSPRVYKKAFNVKTAINMINEGQCGVFNPRLLDCFNKLVPEIVKQQYAGL